MWYGYDNVIRRWYGYDMVMIWLWYNMMQPEEFDRFGEGEKKSLLPWVMCCMYKIVGVRVSGNVRFCVWIEVSSKKLGSLWSVTVRVSRDRARVSIPTPYP